MTLLALLGAPSAWAAVVRGQSTVISWSVGSGPVAGYYVMVHRNGSAVPEFPLGVAKALVPIYEIQGEFGDRIRVRVAPYDKAGNVGPPSPFSQEILFVDPADDSGSPIDPPDPGSGGGAVDPLPPCGEDMLVLGEDRLRVRDGLRERGMTGLRGVLCGGKWWGVVPGDAQWAGEFERVARKGSKSRKLRLELDEESLAAIFDELERRLAEAGEGAWTLAPRSAPRLRVKFNRGYERAKWSLDLKFEARQPASDEVRTGRYRFKLEGALSPALAAELRP
ncbi:MAG: hypothetical protein ACQGVK_17725 [Myxococcota bacterium]